MARTEHRILLTRHPQTRANKALQLSGRDDVDLTPEGEEQMYRAIEAIVAWEPDRIWCSPLSRCKSIAEEAASRLGIECVVKPDLAEIEFGSLQGKTVLEARQMGYDFPWRLDEDGHSVAAPGAESFEHMYERCKRLLDELRPLSGRTSLVAHGAFTRAFLGAAFDTPLQTFWNLVIPNVSSQVLTCNGDTFSLAGLGLAPEEVIRRTQNPQLLGADSTSTTNISGSDR